MSAAPTLPDDQTRTLAVPIIINEYDWLWLNRDGSPTCLTDKVYKSLLGPNSTVEQRRMLHARYVAALTEFWRCHREAAAVLHFCGLGYSRPGDKPRPEGGSTCDDFIDVENLVFEPLFEQYVREAFNPVGLMLDFWAEEVPAGSGRPLKVFVDQRSRSALERPLVAAHRARRSAVGRPIADLHGRRLRAGNPHLRRHLSQGAGQLRAGGRTAGRRLHAGAKHEGLQGCGGTESEESPFTMVGGVDRFKKPQETEPD